VYFTCQKKQKKNKQARILNKTIAEMGRALEEATQEVSNTESMQVGDGH
jgi:hypothetical protein